MVAVSACVLAACESDPHLAILIERLRLFGSRTDLGQGFCRLYSFILVIVGILHLKGHLLQDAEQLLTVGQLAPKRNV
jgi:hypothetical protein